MQLAPRQIRMGVHPLDAWAAFLLANPVSKRYEFVNVCQWLGHSLSLCTTELVNA